MSVDRSNLDEVIHTATLVAKQGGAEALDRLGSLVGVDLAKIGSGEGQLDAVMAVLMLPKAEVQRLLPVGLELAPNPLSPVGKHPVLVQLSHWRFEFGNMDYDEAMLAVPYVQLSSCDEPRRGPFLYMPRLYLNEELPRLMGVHLYGYEKLEAAIDRRFPAGSEPGSYRVSAEGSGAPLLDAAFTPSGPSGSPSSFASFAQLRQLLEMPTLSQAARIWDADAASSNDLSPYLASNIVYHFDAPDTQLVGVGVRLTIASSYTPHGLTGTYEVPPLQATVAPGNVPKVDAAFRISVKVGVALPSSPATLRYPVPKPARRQRVLVLGGGPAACAAAYWLARQHDRYEVHMYTQGFRLGGKCAAGRNRHADMRIEEHGLHAFLGFYENAFRTVSSVYQTAGLRLDDGGGPLSGAFIGSNQNGLMIDLDGRWKYFRTPLGLNDRVPGRVPEAASGDDDQDLSLAARGTLSGMGELMVEAFRHAARQTKVMQRRNAAASRHLAKAVHAPEHQGLLGGLVDRVRDRVQELREDVSEALRWDPPELVQLAVRYLEDRAELEIARWLSQGTEGPLEPVYKFCRLVIRILDEYVEHRGDDDEVWYRWMTLSTTLTAIAGLIEDRVTNLAQLDGEDMWAWFQRHRLDPRLIPEDLRERPVEGGQKEGSPVIAGVYETLFAHGKEAEPRELAAGVGLRWMFLTAFGYAGYPAYEFKFSAPQTMLMPYHDALTKALGAEIHYFHRVTELVVEGAGDERRLVAVKLQRQATVKQGSANYDPGMRDAPPSNPKNQPPWPNEPNYEQLVEGERLRSERVNLESPYSPWPGVGEVELRVGRDFDLCVLGIPLGALPPLTRALWSSTSPSHDPRWTTMLEDIAITETLSFQLWFDKPESELYAVGDDVDGNTGEGRGLLTNYVNPEPSMGDMTHLIKWEGWKPGNVPKFLAYHTGSLTAQSVFSLPSFDDHEYPGRREAWWRAEARAWLKKHHAAFYDRAPRTWEGFLEGLTRPSGASPNADRLDVQFFNAGSLPSDMYVLSQPKGMPARMGQMESGVYGLYLCGDWTRTDMNCGCVEAATQAGMLCARGISGHPVYVWHPGF